MYVNLVSNISNKKNLNCNKTIILYLYKLFLNILLNLKKLLFNIINIILKEMSSNKKIYKSSLFYYFISILFIISIKNIEVISEYQEINVTINGTGTQQIVYNNNQFKPDKILINGILQNYSDYYVYNLTQNINVITIRWEKKLTSCFWMFSDLKNITHIDFSNFDVSEVFDMTRMFYNLYLLKELDLSSFNTSSLYYMQSMFEGCISLVSLNLKNFDTSKIYLMTGIFQNVKSLKILDLSSFNTSSVESMNCMFCGCSSLISLNLKNFDTSNVVNFNFMFLGCDSLIYLNLNSFYIRPDAEAKMLDKASVDLLCYDSFKASKINNYTNNYNNNCFKNQSKLIIDNKTCIDECYYDNIYKYEYNNICFKTCSEISEYLYGNLDIKFYYNYNKTKCLDKIPDGYYLNDTNNNTIDKCNIKCKTCNNDSNVIGLCLSCNIENNYYPFINDSNIDSYIDCLNYTPSGYILDNNAYKPCYSSCKECIEIGDNYNHQCSECIDNYYLNNTNCYQNCSYYYYFNELHEHYCTIDNKCPENKSKLIVEKGECIDDCAKDNIYKYEYNNTCYHINITNNSIAETEIILDINVVEAIENLSNIIIEESNNEKNTPQVITTLIINNHIKESIILDENIDIDNNIEKISNVLDYSYIKEEGIEEIKKDNDDDIDNDKIIEELSNKLNNTYVKEEEIEKIKNGNDLILIENDELKAALTKSDNNINEKKMNLQ